MRLIYVSIVIAVVLCSSSCTPLIRDSMEITVQGGGEFPAFLAGKWKGNVNEWEINLEPDGTISSAVIPLARVRVSPGRKTIMPLKGGGKAVYESGKWYVTYSPDTRELAVEINIKHFRAQIGPNVVEGTRREFLVGPVLEDGKTWYASVLPAPSFIVDTPYHKRYELPINLDEIEAELVVFEKIAEQEK